MNDAAFISYCNLQIMSCVLCHLAIVNVDVHNLTHRKSLKGLMSYNKDHNTSFLNKTCFRVTLNKIYEVGVVGVDDKCCKRS